MKEGSDLSKKILKELICNSIDDHRKEILRIAREVQNHPELGYKEEYLSKKIAKIFEKMDLDVEDHIALTGCKTTVNEDLRGPNIAVIAALDAGLNPFHPDANEEGAVHDRGNNHQVAMMIAVAIGLVKSHAVQNLDGKVTFVAVPAQESVDLDYRDELIKDGKIKYRSGIKELIRRECFDEIDIALSIQNMDLGDEETNMVIAPKYSIIPEYEGIGVIMKENAMLFYHDSQIKWTERINQEDFFNIKELSQIMPTLQPLAGGVKGPSGTKDFELIDKDIAYFIPAKIMALTIVDLLYDNAKKTRKILKNHIPPKTIEEYLLEKTSENSFLGEETSEDR